MSEKTFSDKAKDIMNKESDPALQQDLLAQLMEEQEAYKAENGMNEPQMAPDQFAEGGSFGGGLNVNLNNNFQNSPYVSMFNSGFHNQINPNRFSNNVSAGIDTESLTGDPFLDQLESGVSPAVAYSNNYMGGDGGLGFGREAFDGSNLLDSSSSWVSQHPGAMGTIGVGAQMIPSIVSGISNYFGNRSLRNTANEYADQAKDMYSTVEPNVLDYEPTKTSLLSPQYISLDRERSEANRTAREMQAVSKNNSKNASRSRGEYLANVNKSSTETQRVLGKVLGDSYTKESQMNNAERARVQSQNSQNTMANNQFNAQNKMNVNQYNAQSEMQANMFNAQSQQAANNQYWNWKQQAMGYQGGMSNALPSVLGEATDIMQYNANLNAMNQGKYSYTPSFMGGQFMFNQG